MSATEKLHQETTLFTSARSNQVHNRQVVLFWCQVKIPEGQVNDYPDWPGLGLAQQSKMAKNVIGKERYGHCSL